MLCWYACCVCVAIFGSDLATWGPLPIEVPGYLACAASAVGMALPAVAWLRSRRDEDAVLRRQLAAMIRDRAAEDSAWLNRDDHLVFALDSGGVGRFRYWTLMRSDEDPIREAKSLEPGSIAVVTSDVFWIEPGATGYRREVFSMCMEAGTGGGVVTGPSYRALASASDVAAPQPGSGLPGLLRGMLHDDPEGRAHAAAELREVIRQFEGAEPYSASA